MMDNPKLKLLNINMPQELYDRKQVLATCVLQLLAWMNDMNKVNGWDSMNFVIKTSSDESGDVNGILFKMTEKGITKTWH